jgi:hypothetical protein
MFLSINCHFPSGDVIYLPHFKYILKREWLASSTLLLSFTPFQMNTLPTYHYLHPHPTPKSPFEDELQVQSNQIGS